MSDLHRDLAGDLLRIAADTGFSGVVRLDVAGETVFAGAFGLAHRPLAVPNTLDTRFATASGTKGLTALTVLRLVEDGRLELSTPARSLLDRDLPLIDDDVTVEHLLAHRSGIGDYVDEEAIADVTTFLLPVPVGRLATTEDYLAVLDGHPGTSPAGERFAYCNSGYVVLALLAERATGRPFHDLVSELVCTPAGMARTGFLRSDELPAGTAVGYLSADSPRTNVHRLPVVGSGDGGCYSTVDDVHALWGALDAGRVVAPATYATMVDPRSEHPSGARYGLGFWRASDGDGRWLEGHDAGVSFRSTHHPSRRLTWTVISNTTTGAWPLARHLRDAFPA